MTEKRYRPIFRFLSLLLCLCLVSIGPAAPPVLAAEAAEEERDLSPLPDEWFDDVVFLGDSISSALKTQCESTGELGKAQFLYESSFNVRSAVWGYLQLKFQERFYMPRDVLPLTGAGKVFIMLGINDIGQNGGIELTMELWKELCAGILEKDPELQIFIQSCLPMYKPNEHKNVRNDRICEYNERLRAFCEEQGFVFVNLADYFRDETGGLDARFSSDLYVHINSDAAALWVEQLKNPENYSADPRSF